jgi:hypothetical protein
VAQYYYYITICVEVGWTTCSSTRERDKTLIEPYRQLLGLYISTRLLRANSRRNLLGHIETGRKSIVGLFATFINVTTFNRQLSTTSTSTSHVRNETPVDAAAGLGLALELLNRSIYKPSVS